MTRAPSGPALLVCCGLATLDVVQVVDHVPSPDEKIVAEDLQVTFGGPAANAAATAVALGVRTVLVTALGSGPIADLVRAGLASAGVEVVDLLDGVPGSPPVSTVLVTRSTGARAVASVNATGVADLTAPARAAAAWVLDGATALLVDGHHVGAAQVLAAAARAADIPVLLDGGSWKTGLGALLGMVDHAVLSADFVLPDGASRPSEPAAPGKPDGAGEPDGAGGLHGGVDALRGGVDGLLDAVAAFGPRVVGRSAGAGPLRLRVATPDGVVTRSDIRPPLVPPEAVVDTLGAGDVLHGAIAAALARGVDASEAIQDGVRAASVSVRHHGALGWTADRSRGP